MEKKDDDFNKKSKNDSEKMKNLFNQMAEVTKKTVAKDMVQLKHVEVKKQEVSEETIDLARTLKQQIVEHDKFEKLSNNELTILESFQGRRLFLSRIAIIVNQSRIPLGIPGFKKVELENIIDGLHKKGYLDSEKVRNELVFFLTERGKYRVQ